MCVCVTLDVGSGFSTVTSQVYHRTPKQMITLYIICVALSSSVRGCMLYTRHTRIEDMTRTARELSQDEGKRKATMSKSICVLACVPGVYSVAYGDRFCPSHSREEGVVD